MQNWLYIIIGVNCLISIATIVVFRYMDGRLNKVAELRSRIIDLESAMLHRRVEQGKPIDISFPIYSSLPSINRMAFSTRELTPEEWLTAEQLIELFEA